MTPCHILNFLSFQALCSYMVCSYMVCSYMVCSYKRQVLVLLKECSRKKFTWKISQDYQLILMIRIEM